MGSFAFWYEKRANAAKRLEAIVHFNLWIECGGNGNKASKTGNIAPFLDIGFQIKSLSDANDLYFFLPFLIPPDEKKTVIEDLGCKFKSNEDLTSALFNEHCTVTNTSGSKCVTVNGIQDSEPLYVYQLDIGRDIELENFNGGTILKIHTDQIPSEAGAEDAAYYFRFRIKQQPLDSLIHEYSPPGGAFQSLFSTTYMVDFRFHNIRSLDKSLIERFQKDPNMIVPVSQLHFFLMTKAYVDVSSNRFKSVRMIEQNVWKSYVDNYDTNNLVAYHYADKSSNGKYLSSSELFTKFRVERSVLPWYILITVGLGAIGSIIASILLKWFPV